MLLGLRAMGLSWQLGLTQVLVLPAVLTHDQCQRDPTAGGAADHTEHTSTQGQSGACQCQGELLLLGCVAIACRAVASLHCWLEGGRGEGLTAALWEHKGGLVYANAMASCSPHSNREHSMLQDAPG